MKTVTRMMAMGLMAVVTVTWAASPPASLVMIPAQINYQGRLVTPANVPYGDATHIIDLSLYPNASGGTKLWNERYSVQTKDGYFSVNLGSGGTGLLASNPPIEKVMWKADAGSPDTFFMALTLRTDQNGNSISTPVEATPRQQFLTAPFAYRAHQSVYATKADGLFDAPQGVQTPQLLNSNIEIAVHAPLRVDAGSTVYANTVKAHGTSPSLSLLSSGGPLRLGVAYSSGTFQTVIDHASSISLGVQPSATISGSIPGSDINIGGRTVNIGTTNFTMNSQPMFVTKSVEKILAEVATLQYVDHGIDVGLYDVFVVGWSSSSSFFHVVGIQQNPVEAWAGVLLNGSIKNGDSVRLRFLGIRKGLTKYL